MSDLPSHTTHDQLGALLSASRLLTSSIELDALLRVMVSTVTELLSANASSLLLVDPVTHGLIVKVATGPVSAGLKEVRLKMGQGIAGWVAERKKGVIVKEGDTIPDLSRPSMVQRDLPRSPSSRCL